MYLKHPTFILYYTVYVFALEDAHFVYGQTTGEMLENGKLQYQLLQERGKLPKYGSCWKQAVEHIDDGCRYLSEDTQSDVALHLTNCFLAMSGHTTYNCQLDKKPNLRGICINSMTDRAFNVYTEFYTHTQNICWFLRGQLWQETISENTQKVGRQLQKSAQNQEELLRVQKESLQLQAKLNEHGAVLEKIMDNFLSSTEQHQDLLRVMSGSLGKLQGWLLGEVSWIDTVVFYIVYSILIIFITMNIHTAAARLPLLIILCLCILIERYISNLMSKQTFNDITVVHSSYYNYVWFLRYGFIAISVLIVIVAIYRYKDVNIQNNLLLVQLNSKISDISDCLRSKGMVTNGQIEYVGDIKSADSYGAFIKEFHIEENRQSYTPESSDRSYAFNSNVLKDNIVSGRAIVSARRKLQPLVELHTSSRYNLRSRQGTPDLSIS